METTDAYLARKHREIALLNRCLTEPRHLEPARSVDEVIRTKFQLGAALRAQHALQDWNATETAWSTAAHAASGPFTFEYDYQRADLRVSGPAYYALEAGCTSDTIYTASGMAAISALLLALRAVFPEPNILALPGTYGETLELIERFIPDLQRLTVGPTLPARLAPSRASQILILDSSVRAGVFEAVLRDEAPTIDLLLFDTTCFACHSGRIRRVLRWARRGGIPVVLVRSHNKLDTLGAEYGRLGSVVFVGDADQDDRRKRLAEETRNAVRLLGGAAIPAHFPPYVGSDDYRLLMKARVAAILRNGRRSARLFGRELSKLADELHFSHGLYITLRARHSLDEAGARQAADEMSRDLACQGYPIRHAGSFGFDFAATEWFHDAATDRYNVRVAVPDLPSALWDDLSASIATWWKRHG